MLDLKGLLSKARLPMDITRRGFLEVSTVAAAVAAMNAARAQTGAQPYIILSAPKGILIADPSLCVSCQRCELACTEFNDGKADPRLARIKINRGMFYGTEGTSLTSPHNGAYGSDPVCVQDTCRQCDHPVPCANACPKGAWMLQRVYTMRQLGSSNMRKDHDLVPGWIYTDPKDRKPFTTGTVRMDPDDINKSFDIFFEQVGCDKETGVPTTDTLKAYRLDFVIPVLQKEGLIK